jgi:hypothetical protein
MENTIKETVGDTDKDLVQSGSVVLRLERKLRGGRKVYNSVDLEAYDRMQRICKVSQSDVDTLYSDIAWHLNFRRRVAQELCIPDLPESRRDVLVELYKRTELEILSVLGL